uniref:Uncharacterized protein n=1 Tax=Panagrolaimus davidi TaxID=227884 RepID=A0A914R090_9BILA
MQDDGNRESPPPGIVQFQASQTLLDLNKCSAEKTSEPRISSTDFFQSQMKKLEENQKGASQQALTPSRKKATSQSPLVPEVKKPRLNYRNYKKKVEKLVGNTP